MSFEYLNEKIRKYLEEKYDSIKVNDLNIFKDVKNRKDIEGCGLEFTGEFRIPKEDEYFYGSNSFVYKGNNALIRLLTDSYEKNEDPRRWILSKSKKVDPALKPWINFLDAYNETYRTEKIIELTKELGKLKTENEELIESRKQAIKAFHEKCDECTQLKEQLKNTVTTKYHDDLVHDWQKELTNKNNKIKELKEENESLKKEIKNLKAYKQLIPEEFQYMFLKEPNSFYKKPPLGIKPEKLWIEERIDDLIKTINRYHQENKSPKYEWISELYDRSVELNKLNKGLNHDAAGITYRTH